jgi:hypothetical protein
VVPALRKLAAAECLPPYAAQFAFHHLGNDPGGHLDRLEQRVWAMLSGTSHSLGDAARTTQEFGHRGGWWTGD